MRTLILLLEDFPGSDNRVQRQCRALRSAGHEVTVYCATGSSTQTVWEGVSIYRSGVRRIKAGGLARRLFDYAAFPVSAAFWLARHGSRFDLVQAANPPDWLVFSAVVWRWRRNDRLLVLDLHDPMPELMAAQASSGTAVAALRFLERVSCRRADVVLASSQPFADRLAQAHGTAAVVVRNGVDLDRFAVREVPRERCGSEPVRLVYVGTVAARFGVDVAVDAVANLQARGVDVTLDVFGDGVAFETVRERAGRVARGSMRFHGQVPTARVVDGVMDADIGLVPYRDSSFMRLVESTKAFEYAVSGLAVVASDLAPIRGQLGDDGAVFVRPSDSDALADGIMLVLNDHAATTARSHAAQQRALAAAWSATQEVYLSALTFPAEVS